MSQKNQKTNAMRLLERAGYSYTPYYYSIPDDEFSGRAVASLLGAEPEQCFKTLCVSCAGGGFAVFSIPVCAELDLKKAAVAIGEKRVELAHTKELKAITGYERGSVSPIGLKKPYRVVIDESARGFDAIEVSGGAKGVSLMIKPEVLMDVCKAAFADITAR